MGLCLCLCLRRTFALLLAAAVAAIVTVAAVATVATIAAAVASQLDSTRVGSIRINAYKVLAQPVHVIKSTVSC